MVDPNPAAGGRIRILYDPQTNAYVELPEGRYELVLGREAYDGIPVPILPDRRRGDSFRLKENLRDRVGKIMAAVINTISRHHAILYVQDSGVLLRDAGSREGTKVDGASLRGSDKHLLSNRKEIQLSAWSLVYYDDPADVARVMARRPEAFRLDPRRLGS